VLAAKKAELAALQQQLAGMTAQLSKAAADKVSGSQLQGVEADVRLSGIP
jgi:hypothetical protein